MSYFDQRDVGFEPWLELSNHFADEQIVLQRRFALHDAHNGRLDGHSTFVTDGWVQIDGLLAFFRSHWRIKIDAYFLTSTQKIPLIVMLPRISEPTWWNHPINQLDKKSRCFLQLSKFFASPDRRLSLRPNPRWSEFDLEFAQPSTPLVRWTTARLSFGMSRPVIDIASARRSSATLLGYVDAVNAVSDPDAELDRTAWIGRGELSTRMKDCRWEISQ